MQTHRPRDPHNPARDLSQPQPIFMRHKGRYACTACKKAHTKCVPDDRTRPCSRCSQRRTACSRLSNPRQLDTAPPPTAALQVLAGPNTSIQPVSQDAVGQPHHVGSESPPLQSFVQPGAYYGEQSLAHQCYHPSPIPGMAYPIVHHSNRQLQDMYSGISTLACTESRSHGPLYDQGSRGSFDQLTPQDGVLYYQEEYANPVPWASPFSEDDGSHYAGSMEDQDDFSHM